MISKNYLILIIPNYSELLYFGQLSQLETCSKKFICIYFLKILFIEVTLAYITLCFMCTTLYFYFCMHYSVLSTKNLVSIWHHVPFTHFAFPPSPLPIPLLQALLYSQYLVFVWFGCVFILFVFIFHKWVKSDGICLSLLDLFYLE